MSVKRKTAGDEITKIARQLVELHPDAPARTLGRRLQAEANGAITLEQAYMRIRYHLGLQGKKNRKAIVSSGSGTLRPQRNSPVEAMPASRAEPWEPYVLKVTGAIGVLSDIHVPYHDETALRLAVEHCKESRIDALVLNGDIGDFYSISRWDKNPKKRNFKAEVDAQRQMLAWLRQEFPEIPIVLKKGNHEERWDLWLHQHAPEICDDPIMGLDNWLQLDRHGIALVGDKRPILAGKLPLLHGHEKGTGIAAPVNQARGAFLRLHHTVLEGHGHRTSGHCEPDMWGREVFCWSTGCLCDLHPDYARLNKWNHGAAIVRVDADGQFDVENFRIAGGKVRQS
jgi:hypothetical protein